MDGRVEFLFGEKNIPRILQEWKRAWSYAGIETMQEEKDSENQTVALYVQYKGEKVYTYLKSLVCGSQIFRFPGRRVVAFLEKEEQPWDRT